MSNKKYYYKYHGNGYGPFSSYEEAYWSRFNKESYWWPQMQIEIRRSSIFLLSDEEVSLLKQGGNER